MQDLLTRFHAGVHGYHGNCSTTYYDRRLEMYLHELREGGTVIDGSFLPYEVVANQVFHGPLPDVNLDPWTVSNPWVKAETWRPDVKLGCLSSVGVALYAHLWQQVGARIGTRIGNMIHWDDDEHVILTEEEYLTYWRARWNSTLAVSD